MKSIVSVLCLLTLCGICNAQIQTPAPSPLTTISQKIGVTDLELKYSRPSVKDRVVFSKDGLVSYGEYWRTGANSPTTIKVSDDVTIAGNNLPKGEYVLLTKPEKTYWDISIYPKEKGGWNKYTERNPVVTLRANTKSSTLKMESLLIYFDNVATKSAELNIHWDRTIVSIPIEVEVHEKVMASIEKVMKGPSDFDYFYAASYLYSADQDLEKALEYIQKAANGDNPTFFFSRREATILAKLGRYKEAIVSAHRSNELGEKAGNVDVIKLNDKSIVEWKEKMQNK